MGTVPDLPALWLTAGALPVVLLVAWAFGAVARLLLRGRARLGVATSIVISILATSLGMFIAGWINPDAPLWSVLSLLLCLGLSVAGIALYGAVAAHFQHPQRETVAELLAAGESDRVEFKSTARVNLRTGARDDRMEQVIAKTACAFLNADGGTLVIGVDDLGTPLGLDADLATMKSPDLDRYELWLRDLLTTALGQNAAAGVSVEFATVPDAAEQPATVCRVTCVPSPRPVYLRPSKAATPELWVRSGNSTRQLGVDEATEYVMHRWPLNLGSSIAAQLRAAVRFSEVR
ncbi:MAG: ATP-binding protein [Actinobacteria bacterium]|nr:ATP-binding protein [Actinomycetota bacterium]